MNRYTFFICSALIMASSFCADAKETPLDTWRVKTVNVHTPFLNDTVNYKSEKYKSTNLLETPSAVKLNGGTVMAVDNDGFISLDKATKQNAMHILQTKLRAARFSNGTLNVTSRAPFSVLVDGQKKTTKESMEDSISSGSTQKVALKLEPEHDVIITVRVLSLATDSITPDVKVVYEPAEDSDSVEIYTGADLKRRLTLADTHFSNRVTGLDLSQDGKYLLMRTYNFYDKDHYRTTATVTDLSNGKVINGNMRWNARWMPNQNKLYYSTVGKDGNDLYLVDPVTGAENLVATGLPEEQILWAPDGKWFLYMVREKGIEESGPLRRYASPDDRMPGNRERSYIMRYDLESGISQQLTYGSHSTYLNDISPDGKKILVSTTAEQPTVRPFYTTTFYELNLTTMQADTLVQSGPQFVTGGSYSPDGKKILFTGSPESFNGLGRNIGTHQIANDFDIQLYIMDIATKDVRCITRQFNPSVSKVISWNQADGKIYFIAEEGFSEPVFSYDPVKDAFTKLPVEIPVVNSADMALHNARQLVYTGQSYIMAGRAYLLDQKSGRNTLLADPYGEHLAEIELGKIEPWNFVAKDSTLIEGYVCYPPDFNPDKKYPLIVYYYGGTSPSQQTLLQPYTPQLLASRDYMVYVLNPSGTTGYGQEFSARHVNAWGKYTASDIIEGVEKFCQAHPQVDKDKIGCMGASYGGFMTQYLLTQTPMFAAAVSHAGISNVTSYWGEGYWGYSYNSVAAADSYPWSNPDLYTKQGSLFNADKITTPLLLLHGTVDTNVPIGESIQIFNALRVLGKDVEFVSVEGENHFISDIDKRQLWQNTIMAWFAKQLQGDSRWWDDLYPTREL